jgi:hypothetical protein
MEGFPVKIGEFPYLGNFEIKKETWLAMRR